MSGLHIGIDTSCYTTSIACVDSEGIVFDRRTMLLVADGERGLRQSDGVFLHVRNLPSLTDELFREIDRAEIRSVSVSTAPTNEQDSYMPVFLAGRLAASAISNARSVPLFEFSHQAGHVRAAMHGNAPALPNRFYAFHLSGGTTDVLDVSLRNGQVGAIARLGGSADLHAGQFVDRVGVRLGLHFPCGKAMELLAAAAQNRTIRIPSSVRGCICSLSGAEAAVMRLIDQNKEQAEKEDIAYAVYDCLARTVAKMMDHLPDDAPVLLSGGVSSSMLLRTLLKERTSRFFLAADPPLSADNAVGIALLGRDAWEHANA